MPSKYCEPAVGADGVVYREETREFNHSGSEYLTKEAWNPSRPNNYRFGSRQVPITTAKAMQKLACNEKAGHSFLQKELSDELCWARRIDPRPLQTRQKATVPWFPCNFFSCLVLTLSTQIRPKDSCWARMLDWILSVALHEQEPLRWSHDTYPPASLKTSPSVSSVWQAAGSGHVINLAKRGRGH